MSYIFHAFFLSLKRQLRSWRTWILVLILPALVLAIRAGLPEEELSAPVQVGVVLPEKGGQALWECLTQRSEAVIDFQLTDEETLCAKVASGQWDCGFVVDEDFDRRVKKADTDELIIFYTGPASTVYPLVQETVASAMMQVAGPYIARDYARQIALELNSIEALDSARSVQVQLQTLTGEPLAVERLAAQGTAKLLYGIMALILLIWAMFSAMDLGGWYGSCVALRLRMVRNTASLLLPRAAAAVMPGLLSALVGTLILRSSVLSMTALLPYCLTMCAMALVLCRWQRVWAALPCLMPFIAVLALLLSPVVFDISALYPPLADLCGWLPVTLYLEAVDGNMASLGLLWLEGLGLLSLFLLFAYRFDRKTHCRKAS